MSLKLGVNIDHVATLRQARYRDFREVKSSAEPRILDAVRAVEKAGADSITIHLREDRRHIQDSDVRLVHEKSRLPLNLEMANTPEIVKIALQICPEEVCLVPERRAEVTTEGGLDVVKGSAGLCRSIEKLVKRGIVVSLFVAPDARQIRAAARSGAQFIELHTGAYADARDAKQRQHELKRLKESAELAQSSGLRINAGHGIRYTNIAPILKIPHLECLNIGHSIVSRAISVGLEKAVREMLKKMR